MNSTNWPTPKSMGLLSPVGRTDCGANAEAMGSNSVEVPKFFQVNFQLLKLQLLPLRRSHLYINLYRPSSHHLHSMQSNRVSNVYEITAIFLFWAPSPTQRITGNPFRISRQPDWQIVNSFVNRPIMVRLKSSYYRWESWTRRFFAGGFNTKFSSFCGAPRLCTYTRKSYQ